MSVDPAKTAPEISLGALLNKASGVQTEKNLYGTGGKDKMDKDSFLKMFTEQLKNQDPLNPAKSEQFSQQMAMFSQLEQQINMNKSLEKMLQQQSNMQLAALQLVGKQIEADKGALYHDKEKITSISFALPQDASDLKVEILDTQGELVQTIQLGGHETGTISTKWDGTNKDGRPVESGKYSYRASGKGPDGKEMTISTKIDGKVNGVTTEKGVTFLLVGDQKVGLNDVQVIKEATPEALAGALPNGQKPLLPGDQVQKAVAPGQKAAVPVATAQGKAANSREGADEKSPGTKAEDSAPRGNNVAIDLSGMTSDTPSIEDVAGNKSISGANDRMDFLNPLFMREF